MNELARCSVLRQMFATRTSTTAAGESVAMHSNLSKETAELLHEMVLTCKPKQVIEVGMAYGVSTLAILTALERNGGTGRLISIDPFQSTQWGGCGLSAVRQAGLQDRHMLVEEFDYAALPRLLAAGQRAEFAFIDGWHTFDYTLLDFWYLDRMVEPGGVIGFDDCEYPAVHKAIQFVQTHRRYVEIESGLPLVGDVFPGLRGRVKRLLGNDLTNRVRRWTGRKPVLLTRANRYFRKTEAWEPDWNYFAEF